VSNDSSEAVDNATWQSVASFSFANFISLSAMWLQRVATLWVLWTSGSELGALAAAEFIPVITLTPLAGVWIERYGSGLALRSSQVLSGLFAGVAAASVYLEWSSSLVLIAAIGVNAACGAFYIPARLTELSRLVPLSQFGRATGLMGLSTNAAMVIGPLVAGSLLAAYAPGVALAASSLAFFLSGLFYGGGRSAIKSVAPPPATVWQDLKGGFVAVLMSPALLVGMAVFLLTGGLARGLIDMLPAFVSALPTPSVTFAGYCFSAAGAGTFALNIWIVARGQRASFSNALWGAAAAFSALSILWWSTDQKWILGSLFMLGGGVALNSLCAQNLVRELSSDQNRARLLSIYAMIWRGAPPLGLYYATRVSSVFGLDCLPTVLGGTGFVAAAVALLAGGLLRRQARNAS
jgi:MFS family permease